MRKLKFLSIAYCPLCRNRRRRNKKFTRYLINNCYPVGIDGTQKIAFSTVRDEQLLQRRIGPKVDPDSHRKQDYQYYVYVLEASLCFRNGRQSSR